MATSTEQFEQGEIAEVYIADNETWYRCRVLHIYADRYSVRVLSFTDEGAFENLGWVWYPWPEHLRKVGV